MNRRRLLQLGATLFAAPAIVRAESLMRVCMVPTPIPGKTNAIQRRFVQLFAQEFERNRILSKTVFIIDGWESREPGGIITIKRPNFSETRLWPESEQ